MTSVPTEAALKYAYGRDTIEEHKGDSLIPYRLGMDGSSCAIGPEAGHELFGKNQSCYVGLDGRYQSYWDVDPRLILPTGTHMGSRSSCEAEVFTTILSAASSTPESQARPYTPKSSSHNTPPLLTIFALILASILFAHLPFMVFTSLFFSHLAIVRATPQLPQADRARLDHFRRKKNMPPAPNNGWEARWIKAWDKRTTR